ncbi:unnamed protein product [Caretta caretta]
MILCTEKDMLPTVDQTLTQLSEAKIFSKLDAIACFWQIPQAKESIPLTTFITPFGRYYFNHLPFGMSSAPEHFQKRITQIISGLPGILCYVDDVLVYRREKNDYMQF